MSSPREPLHVTFVCSGHIGYPTFHRATSLPGLHEWVDERPADRGIAS